MRAPFLFFVEIGRLSLCGRLRQKIMHQISRIGIQNWNFSPLLRGHIPIRHPLTHPSGAEVLLVLNFGAPSYKKLLDPPCHSSVSAQGSRKETSGVPNWRGGGWGRHCSTLLQGAKITDSLPPPPMDDLLDTPLICVGRTRRNTWSVRTWASQTGMITKYVAKSSRNTNKIEMGTTASVPALTVLCY